MVNKRRYTDEELRERKRARNQSYYNKNRERLLEEKRERNRKYYQEHKDTIAIRSLHRYHAMKAQ